MISAFSCRISRRSRAIYASVFAVFASVEVLPDSGALAWALQAGAARSARMINAADGAFFKYFMFPPSKLSLRKHEYNASRPRRTGAVPPRNFGPAGLL